MLSFYPTGQNHNRSQEKTTALSRSSSDGVSNRMSISSDTECPAPGPLCPSLPQQINPDITEEEGEGQPTPSMHVQSGGAHCPEDEKKTGRKNDGDVEVGAGEGQGDGDATLANSVFQGGSAAGVQRDVRAGLNYDSVKYTLVVDENAQLELVSLKDCFHGYNEHNDDSDTETVYQSANEEEDPDYEEERKRGGKASHKGMNMPPPLPHTHIHTKKTFWSHFQSRSIV